MKKLQVILMALVAVFALSAAVVSSASAETTLLAEWLAGGKPVTSTLASASKGSLKLEDSETLVGKAVVECKGGTLEGTVGANGADEVLKILNAAGKEVEANLKGEAYLCEGTTGCEKDATETEAWPVALPILTLLFLLENGTFTILFYTKTGGASDVGWEIKCLVLGTLIEDTCASEDIQAEALNVTGGVELMEKSEPGSSCTEGKSKSGFAENVVGNLTTLTSGETLTMSSEGEEG